MKRPLIVHLIDDTTAGGVMRVLDHLATAPLLANAAEHRIERVRRGQIRIRPIKADIIVSHLSISWRTLPAMIALRAAHAQTPLVHVEHSYTEGFVARNVRHKARFQTLLRTAFALFDRVVAVSEAQGMWLVRRGFVPAQRMTVIRSCVDLAPFRAVADRSGPVRVLGAIGRLDTQKGFDVLIAAFRRCRQPDLALEIWGEGPQEPALRALAAGDPRIRFMGFAADPVAPFAGVDAVLIPSRWEAYGLVAVEALSAGRVVVTSGADGLADHARGGAVSVGALTEGAWAKAISELGAADPKAAGAPAAYRVTDLLTAEFADAWAGLIADLLAPAAAPRGVPVAA